jgi:hypothetical protein
VVARDVNGLRPRAGGRGAAPWAASTADGSLAVSEDVAAMARELAGGIGDQAQRSERVLTWVSRQIGHADDPGHDESPEATLASRRGSCVGRSGLAVAMLRAANVPARSVHGLLLPPGAPPGSVLGSASFVLHRWVESHVEGVGWLPSDPGASVHVVDARHVFLALDDEPYDPEAQRELVLRVVRTAGELPARMPEDGGRPALLVRRLLPAAAPSRNAIQERRVE